MQMTWSSLLGHNCSLNKPAIHLKLTLVVLLSSENCYRAAIYDSFLFLKFAQLGERKSVLNGRSRIQTSTGPTLRFLNN